MDDVGQQCVMRLRRDHSIAPTVEQRRLLARTVLTVGHDFPIVAFGWGDTHGHMAVAAAPDVAAEAARRIESALKQALALPVPFAPVDLEPIRDVWHMKNVVRYIFTQDKHHGFDHDPLHEGSSLPDALGWRTLGVRTAHKLKEQSPRLRRTDILDWIDMVDPDCAPRWDGDWLDAVGAAICRSDGCGKHRDAVVARAAVVAIARESFAPAEICDRLHVSPRTYRRLAHMTPSAAVKRAVRQQLVLSSPTFVRSAAQARKIAEALEATLAPADDPFIVDSSRGRFVDP